MIRWTIVFLALIACALINLSFGKDLSPFIAAALIALALADEEREYGEGNDNDD